MEARYPTRCERHTALQHQPDASGSGTQARRRKRYLQEGGVLLSLCGVLACNYLGFGLGRVVCQGLLMATLGAPARRTGVR